MKNNNMSFQANSAADRLLLASLASGAIAMALHALNRGADANTVDGNGSSALHLAASRGNVGAVSALIHAGANKDALDKFNLTPEGVARLNGNTMAARRLATQG